jgi:hypothetical protein
MIFRPTSLIDRLSFAPGRFGSRALTLGCLTALTVGATLSSAASSFAQGSPLSPLEIRQVDDALSWPLIAERLRLEGVEDGVVGDLIAIGREHRSPGLHPSHLLGSVLAATIEFGALSEVSAVVALLVEEGLRGGGLELVIERAHADAELDEGSGEPLEGSGSGRHVDRLTRMPGQEQQPGHAPGDRGEVHVHDTRCNHYPGELRGDPPPEGWVRTSPPPPEVEWVPGSGTGGREGGTPEHSRQPRNQPGSGLAEPQWVPGSGIADPARHPAPSGWSGAGQTAAAAGGENSAGSRGAWAPGSGLGGGNGQGGGAGRNAAGGGQ